MQHHHNIFAYLWGQCWQISPGDGFNDALVNNTCITISPQGYPGDCGGVAPNFTVAGNVVCTQNGTLDVCGHPLAEWQRLHPDRDVGTTVRPWPSDAELIASARALLFV